MKIYTIRRRSVFGGVSRTGFYEVDGVSQWYGEDEVFAVFERKFLASHFAVMEYDDETRQYTEIVSSPIVRRVLSSVNWKPPLKWFVSDPRPYNNPNKYFSP